MQPGDILLHYRLLEKIGEGGMGVVWKAVDDSLHREVAIKVLPAIFAGDAERLVRFEREARLLASLNHPNIATVHGLHEAEGIRFLAMELVAGEDLATRLARGPLQMNDALAVAIQIAQALEAAHAQGVVHRDLKPANVVVTADGAAKVLDFGLAKVALPDAASPSGSLSLSPTMTSAGTVAGMILGTAAYMSPEQARGKPVDRRADLFSFGCVLYECLTGAQVFKGETVSDSMAAILCKDPDWSLLPAGTPPTVRLLLRRCLTRDPSMRMQDAGDVRLDLQQAIDDPRGESLGLSAAAGEAAAEEAAGRGTTVLPWAIAGAAVLLAAWFGMRGAPAEPAPASARRLMIPVAELGSFEGHLESSPPAISTDGRWIAFGGRNAKNQGEIWLRAIDDFTARPLAGTAAADYFFWSPDGREIGFFRGGKLRRIDVETGRAQTVTAAGAISPRGGSWNAKGQIIFSPNSNAGVYVVDAAGGEARQITTPNPEIPDCSHRWPSFLPDGEHFLFTLWTNALDAQEQYGGVYVASLSGDGEPRRVLPDPSSARWAPPGHLLVARENNLVAVAFDTNALEVKGEARIVATGVLWNRLTGIASFAASEEGTLVYTSGDGELQTSELKWFDRAGKATPSLLEDAGYVSFRLSPDADRAVASILGESDTEIWVLDLARGVRTRLVHGPSAYNDPLWSGDGARVLYTSQESGADSFYVRPADGSGTSEPVFVNEMDKGLLDWSRDGKYIAHWPIGPGGDTPDIWIHSMASGRSGPFAVGEPFYEQARFSPDARFLAYQSDESGRSEVFVQALESTEDGMTGGARWQVSTTGGWGAHWRDDAGEIVYVTPDRTFMAVAVEERAGKLLLGTPRELFTVDDPIADYDATADHDRFLVALRDAVPTEPLRVVLDWPAEL